MSKEEAGDIILIAVKLLFPNEYKEVLKIIILEAPSLVD